MKENINIEQLVSSTFETFEHEVSNKVWLKTRRKLRRKEFLKFKPGKFNIFYALAILAAGTFSTLLLVDDNNTNSKAGNTEQLNIQQADQLDVVDNNTEKSSRTRERLDKVQSPEHSTRKTNPENKQTENKNDSLNKQLISLQNDTIIQEVNTIEAMHAEEASTALAYFTTSGLAGCAPLTIKVINSSINASTYQWSSDGEINDSTLPEPEFTFRKAGSYKITLVASSDKGLQHSHTEEILVHEAPVSDMEIADELVYNYSINSEKQEWFLDLELDSQEHIKRVISTQYQPAFQEIQETLKEVKGIKSARLVLVSMNQYGCTDTSSTTLKLPEAPTLEFPTAFSPNTGGPEGGYYSLNEKSNTVFHPVYTEQPLEYQLRIYSKTGEILFESFELERGWDGYYQQKLVTRGVYIYQCSGQWNDGTPFSLRGDVTVIW